MSQDLFRKILLVVDSTDATMAAGEFAFRLAQHFGSEVIAVDVVDTPSLEYLTRMRVLVSDEVREFERDLEETARRYLQYVTQIARSKGVLIQTQVDHGSLREVVLRVANESKADAIVMGAWSSSATQKDPVSASRQLILEEAACPVIVVRGA